MKNVLIYFSSCCVRNVVIAGDVFTDQRSVSLRYTPHYWSACTCCASHVLVCGWDPHDIHIYSWDGVERQVERLDLDGETDIYAMRYIPRRHVLLLAAGSYPVCSRLLAVKVSVFLLTLHFLPMTTGPKYTRPLTGTRLGAA